MAVNSVDKAISYDDIEREGFAGGGSRRGGGFGRKSGRAGRSRSRAQRRSRSRRRAGPRSRGVRRTKRAREAAAANSREAARQQSTKDAQAASKKKSDEAAANSREQARAKQQKEEAAAAKKKADAEAADRREQARQQSTVDAQAAAKKKAQEAAEAEAARQERDYRESVAASLGPQELGTIVDEKTGYSAQSSFDKIMADNPNMNFMGATPETVKRDIFGNIYTADDKRLGSMGKIGDLGKLGTLGALGTAGLSALGVNLGTPTFTANEAYQRDRARKMGGPDRRALNREGIYGGLDPLSSSAVARDASPLTTPAADVVNPTTGAIDYSSAMATSPALSNQMLSSPATLPTMAAQGTPYRLRDYYAGVLGQDPSIYQTAANGGRIGKMHGGMMIMGDNGVVNSGIGGILSKYKEIRSEL